MSRKQPMNRKRLTKLYKVIFKAIPDDATFDDLADGIIINFTFEGEKYTFSSKICPHPRCTPIDTYLHRIVGVGIEQVI